MPVLAATIDVALLNSQTGTRLRGGQSGDTLGDSVAGGGDVNGDGLADFAAGGDGFDVSGEESAGSIFITFGGANLPFDAPLDGVGGFRINGVGDEDGVGFQLAFGGDINGDGYGDILFASDNVALEAGAGGVAHVVFGHAGGFPAALSISQLNGVNGFSIRATAPTDRIASGAVDFTDFNGDGFDDMVISAPSLIGGAGRVYVLFGKASAFSTVFDLSTLNGTNGLRFDIADGAMSNQGARGIGDINGDGFEDLVIGSFQADPAGGANAGSTFVVFGKASGFSAVNSLTTLDGTNGFRLDGIAAGDASGISVAGAGDVNGDGFDDVIVGASSADAPGKVNAGAAYVIYGKASGFAATLQLSTLNGTNGFALVGANANDQAGWSVAAAGDVNADGFGDLVIGAQGASPLGRSAAGSAYIVYGKASAFDSVTTLGGAGQVRIDGATDGGRLGSWVDGAGDVNGDWIDDVIVGAPNSLGNAGAGYVIYGGAAATPGATAGADTLTGDGAANRLEALAGDDQLRGQGGDDSLLGGDGADRALYAGTASQYDWWSLADGSFRVKDLRAGAPDGTDRVRDIESLQFSDKTVKILGLTTAEKLTDAYSNILRSTATGSELTFLNNLIGAVNGSTKTLGAAITEIVGKADQTTAVAAMSYQFFLNFVPSKGGFDYLVSPQGPNPNNINSAYYQSFNIENRYINFAVNLGKAGEGAPSFLAEYGAKTLFQATQSAYIEIFGGTVTDGKINTILDTTFQIAGQTVSRAQYFALYGGDGLTGIGTKAAMVGWLLTEAAKADVGMYAHSSNAFLTDLADGAQTLVDVVGTYGKAEYIFNG